MRLSRSHSVLILKAQGELQTAPHNSTPLRTTPHPSKLGEPSLYTMLRTVGILTKLDLIDAGLDAGQILAQTTLDHGFFAIKGSTHAHTHHACAHTAGLLGSFPETVELDCLRPTCAPSQQRELAGIGRRGNRAAGEPLAGCAISLVPN